MRYKQSNLVKMTHCYEELEAHVSIFVKHIHMQAGKDFNEFLQGFV